MAELDVEKLKRLSQAWKDGKRYYGVGDVADQLDAIIAALEDRERLRKAVKFLVEDRHGLAPWALDYLRAALEGRDG